MHILRLEAHTSMEPVLNTPDDIVAANIAMAVYLTSMEPVLNTPDDA